MQQQELQELQNKIKAASAFVQTLRVEVGRFLVGQERLLDRLILGMVTNGHILVEGVPGLAKTLTINLLAQAVGG